MIRVENLTVRVGTFELRDVSFAVPAGRYAVLMGRTGCGKSTLVEALCGLRRVRAGRVLLLGRDVTRLRPGDRGIGYVPQDGALFPTMTVREHLGFALAIRNRPADEIRRVDSLEAIGCDSFKIVEITVSLLERCPQLPGTLLFEHRTVSDIARHIERLSGAGDVTSAEPSPAPAGLE